MPKNTAAHLGKRIQSIRESMGLSLSELARQSGVSRPYLHLIEKGESNPTQEKLSNIAAALGVRVMELTGELELEDESLNIPQPLKDFAEEDNVPPSDVLMLNRIQYRGKQPKSANEWRVLYTVIKGTIDKD